MRSPRTAARGGLNQRLGSDYSALGYWENKQKIVGGALQPMYTYSQVDGGVDEGSYIESNLQVDQQQGIDDQSDYYQGNFDYLDQPSSAERVHAVNWKLTSWSDLPVSDSSTSVNQQSIETALAAGDPVVIGIPVYDNFFYVTGANNGYYARASGVLEGNHAITALGYNSQGLVIENSWGAGWGNNGFATLSWSFVNQDVFDAVQVGPLTTGQPVSVTAPAVSGSAVVGQTLTASTGGWSPTAISYAYQWQRAANASSAWSAISGATSATYAPASADAAQDLCVQVTATNSHGPGVTVSGAVGPITSGGPLNTAAPTVTGTLRQGQTMSASPGAWRPTASSYAYQWQRSANNSTWSNITGATGATYQSQAADVNNYLRVMITDTNTHGQGTASSTATGTVSGAPYNTAAGTVSGTVREGQTLTATSGSWTPAASTYAYQWQRFTGASGSTGTWSNISGATYPMYSLASADIARQMRIEVTATNGYGYATTVSTPTGPVLSGAPVIASAPLITGAAARGTTLTAATGTWNPAPSSYAYQWQHSTNAGVTWSNITGATGASYTPVAADESTELRVVVTGTNPYGAASAPSAATGAVKVSSPVNTAPPSIGATAKVGTTLTATSGTWSGAGNAYGYQWQRSSAGGYVNIAAATSSTYVPAQAYQGVALRVVVTAANPDGTVAAASAATAPVASH